MQDKVKTPAADVQWHDDADEADVLPGTAVRPTAAEPFESVVGRSLSRRALLKGATLTGASLVIAPAAMLGSHKQAHADTAASGVMARLSNPAARLQFETVPPGNEPDVVVPPNYQAYVIVRWGDPLFADAPEFDVYNQTPEAQAKQFGFNADLVLWYPLPGWLLEEVRANGTLSGPVTRRVGRMYPNRKDRQISNRALVVVNHEYTSPDDMFPDFDPATYPTENQTLVEIEAHGFSIVDLKYLENNRWQFRRRSPFNRRVTGSTPLEISGPLRGSDMMKTSYDPAGEMVYGTLNNCAGGKTPWGTIITCEENFDQYFANFDQTRADYPEIAALSERVPAPGGSSGRGWEKHVDRFDLGKEPKEYNRFGYCVEIDPYDPAATPKKRTAMGRFKHEGAAASVAKNGQVAIYSGDDARFEYVYKFITKGKYNKYTRPANMNLLDEGTLYVARFDAGAVVGDDMGTGEWLELSTANPELAGWSMEEILINTRGAADVVGATPMDRPEDIEVSPLTGKVHVCLTNNSRRTEADEANPRVNNQHGHIIEIIEDGDDPLALTFHWNILVKCGDPAQDHDTSFGDIADPVAAGVSPISDPDNVVHDSDGNLWIATDGQFFSGSVGFGQNDGIFAVPVEGPDRGLLRQFMSGVPGGEICGPEFDGDQKTFFCAIQHPHDGEAFEKQWPLDEPVVSKPSLIGVFEKSGKKIGY
ncbi:MAG: PhoX family phosphatase [Thiohalocapsa sp.]|nr:PhoX family phosphatase [Thiohalocapsa sp.]MCF7989156.1 PhoX family phosphatase [Thiohalocapsa sp.]